MKRLWLYLEGMKLRAFGLVLVATGNAAAQTGGWPLVRNAIDKGIRARIETRNRIATVTAQIAESVSGMAVVQAFNREQRFQTQFDELNAANREQNVYTQKLFSIFFPSIEFLGVLATGAVLYTGNSLLTHHTIT